MTSYGFIIDNNKCIGCHACTVACKAEHNVPVGVFRTWVKYVETGEYPNARRLFNVLRCNHCVNAPCVEICPVSALYTREDGIVDFDKNRCIACKSCMQACPYDALYIDPETYTSAKCNYCANRVEQNLQPACVVVCPEQAIISGDLDNPESNIARILSQNNVTVRKPEKGTQPKLFYIEGDSKVLSPQQTQRKSEYLWSNQVSGVGHYAGKSFSNKNMYPTEDVQPKNNRVYDAPAKGRLWGWEFPAYMITKSVATGISMILAMLFLLNNTFSVEFQQVAYIVALAFLGLTGLFLILDLDQPFRFHTILLRPQWKSWLARGAYLIMIYGGFTALLLFLTFFTDLPVPYALLYLLTFASATMTSVYTAFLLAQAKGRDFWQSPLLPFEKVSLSFALGAGTLLAIHQLGIQMNEETYGLVINILIIAIVMMLAIALMEVFVTHSTIDAQTVAKSFKYGSWAPHFWGGLLLGTIIPFTYLSNILPVQLLAIGSLFLGSYVLMRAWIYAPQDIVLV